MSTYHWPNATRITHAECVKIRVDVLAGVRSPYPGTSPLDVNPSKNWSFQLRRSGPILNNYSTLGRLIGISITNLANWPR